MVAWSAFAVIVLEYGGTLASVHVTLVPDGMPAIVNDARTTPGRELRRLPAVQGLPGLTSFPVPDAQVTREDVRVVVPERGGERPVREIVDALDEVAERVLPWDLAVFVIVHIGTVCCCSARTMPVQPSVAVVNPSTARSVTSYVPAGSSSTLRPSASNWIVRPSTVKLKLLGDVVEG